MNMYCIGNWKENISPSSTTEYCTALNKFLEKDPISSSVIMVIAPSFLAIPYTGEISQSVYRSAQNCSTNASGSFTGEISPSWFREVGVSFCIIGHSERRIIFHETNEQIEKKFHLLIEKNVMPIVCVGENDKSMSDKKRIDFVYSQLKCFPRNKNFLIAYEPIWAIGTGDIPSDQWIHKVSLAIKERFPKAAVLYGGSVNPDNSKTLAEIPSIQGFLIGGASLDPLGFHSIAKNIEKSIDGV